jgi:Predicted metal-dependent hydrolase of the TIM-barrel fold
MIIDSHEHLMLPTEMQLKKLEMAGVDKAILFCTAPHPEKADTLEELKGEMDALYKILAGSNSKEDNLKRMKNNIHELAKVLKKYPDNFYGFGSVPLELSVEETKKWIEKYIIFNGLKGLGEFTPGSDEQIRQLENIFQALEYFPALPVWVHTFNPVSLNGIKILMELTKKHPDTPVIFGHMGGYNWMDVIDFAKTVPNAYVDLSAAFSTLAARIAVTELPDKCLFSSDAPYGEPLLSRQLVEYVSPSDTIKNKVLGENILKLLGRV